MSDRLIGSLLVAISATAFGAMAIFGVWAQEANIDTAALVFVRFAGAGVVLAAVVRWRRIRLPAPRTIAAIAAMGGVGYVGQSYCFFLALEFAQASLVVLLLYLYPALVATLAAIFLRDRMGLATGLALGLSLAGTALVVGGGTGQPIGVLLAISAALIYSVYITVGALVTDKVNPMAVSAIVCVAAATVCGLIVAVLAMAGRPATFPAETRGWLILAAIALLCTAVAIVAFFAGLQRLGPTSASVLSTLEPVVAVAMAVALLGEVLSAVQAIGGVFVLIAVIWLAVQRPQDIEAAAPV